MPTQFFAKLFCVLPRGGWSNVKVYLPEVGLLFYFAAMESYGYSPSLGEQLQHWFSLGIAGAMTLFHLWMLIDAVRKREWLWVVYMLFLPMLAAVLYFFCLYRSTATRGFELPGSHDRHRIRELEAKIHHIDNAHQHAQLGDVYFQRGKLDKAEACYRAALQRDPNDVDTRAHLGQCLLRQKRAAEARPLLEGVLRENPKHDYNHTAMAYAETLMALGETENAIKSWEYVVAHNSYPRAKVQLAELYFATSRLDEARAQLNDVLVEDSHAPAFQRRRDQVWISRAKALARKLPS